MTKHKTPLIISGITFAVFMAEAIVHYNLGAKAKDETHKYGIPPMNKLVDIGIIVLVASFISGSISSALIKN